MQIRRFTLPALGATGALALVTLTAGAAGAHVTVTPDTTSAGAYAVLTFSVGHGCEGSPTTKLAIQMPESIPVVTPTVNPNWTVEKVDEQLAEPVTDAHGNEITERTAQVVYTAKTPLADGFRDTVALSVQLPEAAGDTLAFPVVQTCEKGQTGWTETAAEGQDPEELGSPAPVVTITEATGEGHHGGAGTDDADSPADAATDDAREDATADAASDDDGGNGLAIGGLVAGLGGLALGGLALARSGKKG
ncbi:YcnI family protein [Nocardioides sp. L-11A]|uniref:YcnI family copper-binding membrane protein n=1 Tax=Nocardioides sp. L-11A TaxID=3043848 RepID=UPI00249C2D96|nr:YcnI family protein [Nocardioides sp. L-11A]